MPSEESERLRHLRDQQLRSRDPLITQRRLDSEISQKRKRMQGFFSFGAMWRDIPHRWKGGFTGAVIGLGMLVLAPSLIEGTWGLCLGGVAFPFAALVGFLIGRYEDTVDDIRENLH